MILIPTHARVEFPKKQLHRLILFADMVKVHNIRTFVAGHFHEDLDAFVSALVARILMLYEGVAEEMVIHIVQHAAALDERIPGVLKQFKFTEHSSGLVIPENARLALFDVAEISRTLLKISGDAAFSWDHHEIVSPDETALFDTRVSFASATAFVMAAFIRRHPPDDEIWKTAQMKKVCALALLGIATDAGILLNKGESFLSALGELKIPTLDRAIVWFLTQPGRYENSILEAFLNSPYWHNVSGRTTATADQVINGVLLAHRKFASKEAAASIGICADLLMRNKSDLRAVLLVAHLPDEDKASFRVRDLTVVPALRELMSKLCSSSGLSPTGDKGGGLIRTGMQAVSIGKLLRLAITATEGN